MADDLNSHRYSKSKLVRINAIKPDGSHAIITCDKNKMASLVKRYQSSGYTIQDIREVQ